MPNLFIIMINKFKSFKLNYYVEVPVSKIINFVYNISIEPYISNGFLGLIMEMVLSFNKIIYLNCIKRNIH